MMSLDMTKNPITHVIPKRTMNPNMILKRTLLSMGFELATLFVLKMSVYAIASRQMVLKRRTRVMGIRTVAKNAVPPTTHLKDQSMS